MMSRETDTELSVNCKMKNAVYGNSAWGNNNGAWWKQFGLGYLSVISVLLDFRDILTRRLSIWGHKNDVYPIVLTVITDWTITDTGLCYKKLCKLNLA